MKFVVFCLIFMVSSVGWSQSGVLQRPNVPSAQKNQVQGQRPEMTQEIKVRQEKVKRAVEECRSKTGFPTVEKLKSGIKATKEQQQAMSDCMRNSGVLGQMQRSPQGLRPQGRMGKPSQGDTRAVESLLKGKLRNNK